ncbi:hypothetical protein SAMN05421853_102118 [Roseivivax halotolerans]|uniref:Tail sheath protein subtilisin-like domain-containing protein n=1 Tax=Roseivivax halotolerans TaxID=93684 RepID=A0A1I5W475_9RHOB|nr:phage tail sheath subtilisin-like domain-containing protein [Roseivivax halotolerans]SFQ14554.1 hypothetical protein SAMN05421853_102118 [Roseivivax halotolerans]
MPEQFLHGVEVVQVDDGIRPIATANASIIGLVGTAPDAPASTPINEPFLVAGPRAAAELLGTTGTLRDAYEAVLQQGAKTAVMVRIEEGADAEATKAAVVGDPVTQTGVFALEQSESLLGLTPRILAAPGFTTGDIDAVNPVVSSLLSVADKVRAVVIMDGPNTDETDAVADKVNYGSDRLYIVDPGVLVFDTETAQDVTRPASGFVAGLIAKRDLERGFWWSPSNQIIRGITGTARPITFHLSQPDTESNRLNEAGIATIIRRSGFRLWGNRGAGEDALWAFLAVRRTADVLYQSIEAAHLWAMDRPFSAQLIEDIRDSVQAFGQSLVNQGALLGFNCWLDPELNTEANLKAGKLYMNFDFEPPAPLEHLIFRAYRNGDYYEDLVADVQSAA